VFLTVLAFEAIILIDNFQKDICQLCSWLYGHTGLKSIEDGIAAPEGKQCCAEAGGPPYT
jgi:hypothetical protein